MSFIKPGDVGLFTDLYQLTMAQDYLRSTEIFSSEFLEYLVKYDRRPVLKLSTGKLSLPGEKQVYRVRNGDGKLAGDILALSPNPPKDTDGRREDSGRGWVRELQGRWPGALG